MIITYVACVSRFSIYSQCTYRIYLENSGLPVLHDIYHLTSNKNSVCLHRGKFKLYLYLGWHHAMRLYAGAKRNSRLQVVLR